ncbi:MULTISPECIES: hypothetical protein [Frankia]|uniref:hypothetical protein n=1 Tax=Frankia sp. CgS1 TaxID=1745381 RepID=UPI001E367472|nr:MULTISPECIES: hypothetical protein [Frankia]
MYIDVQLGEDRHVEDLAGTDTRAPVQCLRIFEQPEHGGQHLVPGVQRPVALGQPIFQPGALLAYGTDLGCQLLFGPVGIAHEVQQTVLPDVQLLELPFVPGPQAATGVRSAGHHLVEVGLDRRAEVGRQPDVDVEVLDGPFDPADGHVWQVALVIEPALADVVEVPDAALALARHDDQPPSATVTPDQTLQVVIMSPVPRAGPPLGVQHPLYPVEELLGDQRLVPPLVLLAVVADVAEVVAVTQHLANLVDRDRATRPLLRGPGPEAGLRQGVPEGMEVELARGVQLEGHDHERRALRIKRHRAYLAALELLADVEVAQGRHAERAALLGLLAHLVLDVFAADAHLVLVEDGDHAVHRLAGWRGVEVLLGGRVELHAEPFERHHHDRIVVAVPREPRQGVDEDVLDVPVGLDAGDHLLEGRPLVNRLAALPRVDVLVHQDDAQLSGALLTGHPLSRQRDAFRVVVGIDLPGR